MSSLTSLMLMVEGELCCCCGLPASSSIKYVSIDGQSCARVSGCDVGKLEPSALRVLALPRESFNGTPVAAGRSYRKNGSVRIVTTGRNTAAAHSVNSIGSDVDVEGDRHESHFISSCTGGRRNLNTTASRDTGLLLYSRRFLSGSGGGWICYWRSYWRCWNRRRCRIDNSDGRLSDWRWLFDGQRSGNRLDQESRHLANLSNVKHNNISIKNQRARREG